jgi:hypothetical protein
MTSAMGAVSVSPTVSCSGGGSSGGATAATPSHGFLYDVMITHDWCIDEFGRNNHDTNIMLNEALKARSFNTWFDHDRMEGDIVQQMTDGIQKSACVLVSITKRYMEKVEGTNDNDNCKIEFGFAQRNKGASRMIPLPIEPRCLNPQAWTGPVGGILGGQLYPTNLAFDIIADRARFEAAVDKIVDRIRAIFSKL